MKHEANFQTAFRHWLMSNKSFGSAAFELKHSPTNSFPFDRVVEHQENSLFAATCNNGLLFKIPDDSISYKPFDMFYLRNAEAYVVIKYPKDFVIISINDFVRERQSSKRKSLTYERAKEISIKKEEKRLL